MRSVLSYTCCLLMLSLLSPAFATVEILPDFVGEQARILVLIPYNDLYFESETDSLGNVRSVCHSELSISLEDMDLAVYYQDIHTIRFVLPDSAYRANKAYPYEFTINLHKGAYYLYSSLFNKLSGAKVLNEASFRMPKSGEDVGELRAIAWRWGAPFVPRTPWLWSGIDSLSVSLPVAQADVDSVLLYLPGQRARAMTRGDNVWTAVVVPDTQSGIFTSAQAHVYSGGKSAVYACELLTSVYSFQSRFTPKQQLAQMRYIMNSRELRALNKVPEEKLQDEINRYWLSLDPTPGTEQNEYRQLFYSRIEVADQRYTIKGGRAGWQSDRGRIYIVYGDPDEVYENVHPFGSPAYIVWRYYDEMKEYVFYDYMGFGDYELRNKWEE